MGADLEPVQFLAPLQRDRAVADRTLDVNLRDARVTYRCATEMGTVQTDPQALARCEMNGQ
eukprot:7188759-Pyramimonas_sp.AAC.1